MHHPDSDRHSPTVRLINVTSKGNTADDDGKSHEVGSWTADL